MPFLVYFQLRIDSQIKFKIGGISSGGSPFNCSNRNHSRGIRRSSRARSWDSRSGRGRNSRDTVRQSSNRRRRPGVHLGPTPPTPSRPAEPEGNDQNICYVEWNQQCSSNVNGNKSDTYGEFHHFLCLILLQVQLQNEVCLKKSLLLYKGASPVALPAAKIIHERKSSDKG